MVVREGVVGAGRGRGRRQRRERRGAAHGARAGVRVSSLLGAGGGVCIRPSRRDDGRARKEAT
jgi:hypothetical protein